MEQPDAMADINEDQPAGAGGRGRPKGHGAKAASIRDRTVLALVAGRRPADAAADAGIGLRTLQRWLQDASFIDQLNSTRAAAFDCAMQRLMAGANIAADTLVDLLNDGQPSAIRLGAARCVLDHAIERHDVAAIVARLAELERQVKAQEAR
jgi:hypothetical protein